MLSSFRPEVLCILLALPGFLFSSRTGRAGQGRAGQRRAGLGRRRAIEGGENVPSFL